MNQEFAFDVIGRWSRATRAEIEKDPFQLDRDFLAKLLPKMELFARYFDAEVRGLDRLPQKGATLLVGNHSGGAITPDTSALYAAWYRAFGLDRPLFGVAFDAAFSIPGFGSLMRKIGQLPASPTNATRVLRGGHSMLVYPGGVNDAFRLHRDRNNINFHGRKGFVKLALREGVPVVPVVGHGGHDTTFVVSQGKWLARMLDYKRLRLDIAPFVVQFPWGLSVPALPGVPLPAKITMQVCSPLDWTRFGPEGADDPRVVDICYDEIESVMQSTLDRLVRECPNPLLARARTLLGVDP